MVVDMCSEPPSLTGSPRISFSHDLRYTDSVIEDHPCRSDSYLLDSNPEFDFGISNRNEIEPLSSADELFSDGLILPVQLQPRFVVFFSLLSVSFVKCLCFCCRQKFSNFPSPSASALTNQALASFCLLPMSFSVYLMSLDCELDKTDFCVIFDRLVSWKHAVLPPQPVSSTNIPKEEAAAILSTETERKHQSGSFWRIKRSSSLHIENTTKKSSFWSLPLLSRSNSTGSIPKDNQKQNSTRQARNPSPLAASSSNSCPLSQKPPLLKKNYGAYGSGFRINPVLNVPPPYISKRTATLFGLGSFFSHGKDKKSKK
ncbi:hypothetical protein RJ639_030693 [Escallonia herrerae]|uniref:Uncharacterized protein n=1 Tax=Escallonia herrerae TaxID=1293975 RepID=A0AA88X370_9ASTE|nr:hypothetical protein RJ639_030693 [Escallonia herrerae]